MNRRRGGPAPAVCPSLLAGFAATGLRRIAAPARIALRSGRARAMAACRILSHESGRKRAVS
ncbi:hypothetical protein GLA29479_4042 [Lysobacter antibioticus]|nr:hypothetical protein GLA29479_4042 [Lysobacter antibioticus]